MLHRLGRAANVDAVSLEVLSMAPLSYAKAPITVSETVTYRHKARVAEASRLCCHR